MFRKTVTTALLVCLVNVVYQCEAGVIKELPEESLSTVSPTENGTELPAKALKEVKNKRIGGVTLTDENDKGIEVDTKDIRIGERRCAPEESLINGKCQKDSRPRTNVLDFIQGAPRCAPGEIYLNGMCQQSD